MYKSIEEKSGIDKMADTPLLMEEVLKRILEVWLTKNVTLYELFTKPIPKAGFAYPPKDRDYLHIIEDYFNKRI